MRSVQASTRRARSRIDPLGPLVPPPGGRGNSSGGLHGGVQMSGKVSRPLSLDERAAALGKPSTTAWAVDDPASFQTAVRQAFAHHGHGQLVDFIVHLALEAELCEHERNSLEANLARATAGVLIAQHILKRQPLDKVTLKRMINDVAGRPDDAAKPQNLADLRTLLRRRGMRQVSVSDVAAMLREVYGNETQAELVELAGLAARSMANSVRGTRRHSEESGELLARAAVKEKWSAAKVVWLADRANGGKRGWAQEVGVPFLAKHEVHKHYVVSVRTMAEVWLKAS